MARSGRERGHTHRYTGALRVQPQWLVVPNGVLSLSLSPLSLMHHLYLIASLPIKGYHFICPLTSHFCLYFAIPRFLFGCVCLGFVRKLFQLSPLTSYPCPRSICRMARRHSGPVSLSLSLSLCSSLYLCFAVSFPLISSIPTALTAPLVVSLLPYS